MEPGGSRRPPVAPGRTAARARGPDPREERHGPVRAAQRRRRVPGRDHLHRARPQVDQCDHCGAQERLAQTRQRRGGGREELAEADADLEHGVDGAADLRHLRGGLDAVTRDVADHVRAAPVVQGDHVVPVAAETDLRGGRAVLNRHVESRHLGHCRQQFVLEGGDEVPLVVGDAGAQERLGAELGDGHEAGLLRNPATRRARPTRPRARRTPTRSDRAVERRPRR